MIKALAEKVGIDFGNFESTTIDIDQLQEFAELIARECIAQCNDGDSQYFIATHFGIKE